VLADQLGANLAQEAGVDFDGPVIDRTPEPEPELRGPREKSGPRPKRPPQETETRRPEKKMGTEKKFGTEKPGPRKHVSALRSERDKAEKGPRRRVESGATEDRRGRKVVVERVSAAGPRAEPEDTRNARRFRAEREKVETPARKGPPGKGGPRAERFSGDTGAAKHFRRDGAARDGKPGERHFSGPRDEKAGGRDFARLRGEAPSRGFGDRPAGDRPQGRKPTGGKPAGGGPAGGKPFGAKPSGGGSSGPRKPPGNPRTRNPGRK
jgi:23S rRNA pseudouridine2605 synthase